MESGPSLETFLIEVAKSGDSSTTIVSYEIQNPLPPEITQVY
jgi:hypothetical protein